jgi:hypothetical protein
MGKIAHINAPVYCPACPCNIRALTYMDLSIDSIFISVGYLPVANPVALVYVAACKYKGKNN